MVQGKIERLDPVQRNVQVAVKTLTGDYLVIALCAELAPETVPGLSAAGGGAEKAQRGSFQNAACVSCHTPRNPQLVADWHASSHARKTPKADCVACHGNRLTGALPRARRDSACSGCHEKLHRAVVHSYATSKHGVITKLESECHAPRYVAEQSASGARMTGIARTKLREAHALIDQQRGSAMQEELVALERQFASMDEHGRNVRLGVGHQSPDYQWWHGHPALDGDLLRIKGMVSEMERRRALPTARPGADAYMQNNPR